MPQPDATSSRAEDEEFFLALEQRRTRALVERDMEVLQEMHAPEYELVTPAGRVFKRAEYLGTIEREPFYKEWEVGEMACRLGADMTVIRYKATLQFPSGRTVLCWHTDLYEKRHGQWQAVWSQATELREPRQ